MSELFQVSLSIRVIDLRVSYVFQVSLTIRVFDLRVHMQFVFQEVVQLDITLNYIGVAAIGLLYLILRSELAPND